MKKIFITSLHALLLSWTCSAQAISLEFNPTTSDVEVGNAFTVDLLVTELQDEIVSAYDLDIFFDSSLVTLDDVNLGTSLSNGNEDFVGYSFSIDNVSGHVDLDERSLLFDSILADIQGDTVQIATLSFTALAVGASPLQFAMYPHNGVVGLGGQPLELNPVAGLINVSRVAVLEPSAILLIGLGLLGMALPWRRGKKMRCKNWKGSIRSHSVLRYFSAGSPRQELTI